jgi:hypothetical protein
MSARWLAFALPKDRGGTPLTLALCRYLGIFLPSARSAADITVARWLVLQ